MRRVIPYHEDKNFTLTKWKSDFEKFHHCKQTKQKFLCIFSKQLAQVYTYWKSTQFQIQRICPILLLLQMMQISVSLAPLGHFHFMECSIPPTPQDLCSVTGDIFIPSLTLDFVCNFICRIVPRKSWCWQKQFTGWSASASYFLHLFLCHPLFAELFLET